MEQLTCLVENVNLEPHDTLYIICIKLLKYWFSDSCSITKGGEKRVKQQEKQKLGMFSFCSPKLVNYLLNISTYQIKHIADSSLKILITI